MNRRKFVAASAAGVAAMQLSPHLIAFESKNMQTNTKPDPATIKTNLAEALKVPKTPLSMPGLYPGKVVDVHSAEASKDRKNNPAVVKAMVSEGLCQLTGEKSAEEALKKFIKPTDKVGLKVNPIAGKLMSTSHEIVAAVIELLEGIGLKREQIIIWDRFEFQLTDIGYTSENYPGIRCEGLVYRIKGETEKYGGEDRLDKSFVYEFDHKREYAAEWMSGMINGGYDSYFYNLVTQELDKIINIPILKQAGKLLITNCLKNVSYAVTSNCARGHDMLTRFISEVCAFTSVRDKTVLNIVDSLNINFNGGPASIANYIFSPNRIMFATDPVAADTVGWDLIYQKRIEKGFNKPGDLEKYHQDTGRYYVEYAENLGLGVCKGREIDHQKIDI